MVINVMSSPSLVQFNRYNQNKSSDNLVNIKNAENYNYIKAFSHTQDQCGHLSEQLHTSGLW